jgi:hypothetical protein
MEWNSYLLDEPLAHFVVGAVSAGIEEEVFVDVAAVFDDGVVDGFAAEGGEIVGEAQGEAGVAQVAGLDDSLVGFIPVETANNGGHAQGHKQEANEALHEVESHVLGQMLFGKADQNQKAA